MAEEIREVPPKRPCPSSTRSWRGSVPFALELVAPGDLRLLEKNARFMKAEQFQTLVENVKKDGNLSQLPFCYREKRRPAPGPLRQPSGPGGRLPPGWSKPWSWWRGKKRARTSGWPSNSRTTPSRARTIW